MDNAAWAELLGPGTLTDKPTQYRTVEREARKVLTELEPDKHLGTKALVEAMFPEATVRGVDSVHARNAIFPLLLRLARGTMKDCVTRDMLNGRKWYGRTAYPWLWGKGTMIVRQPCSHCAGKGWLDDSDQLATCQAANGLDG